MTLTRDFVSSSFRFAVSFMMSLRTALGFVSDRFSFDLTAQSPFGEFKIGGNTLLGSSEVNNQITTSVNDKAKPFYC